MNIDGVGPYYMCLETQPLSANDHPWKMVFIKRVFVESGRLRSCDLSPPQVTPGTYRTTGRCP